MKAVHIIGVPLDLGGGRRGVDMGPSALRIAGLGEQIAALGYTVVDKGDLPAPIPETQELRDEHKKYIRDIAKVCQKVYQTSLGVARRRRDAARARRRPQPRRRLGGRGRRVGAAHEEPADRAALGRRARRHEHAGDLAVGQRPRHAAGRAARPRAGGARRRSAPSRRRCCRRTPCSSASATSTSARRSRCAIRACTSSR